MCHFIAIREFEFQLPCGNTHIRAKWLVFHLVTLKDVWLHCKTIGCFFCDISSWVHHFKTIGEFKLELQSGNAQIWSKLGIFFVPCDFTIWRITFKNNRAPLLCYFKFVHHFVAIGESNRGKRSIFVKIGEFLSRVTLKFDDWFRKKKKKIAHLFHDTSSFLYLFVAICEFTVVLRSENDQIGSKFDLT